MKICLLHNLYFPYARGGAEKIIASLGERLRAGGHEVFIVAARPYFSSPEKRQGVFYFPSHYYNLSHWPLFLRFFWHLYDLFDLFTALRIVFLLKRQHCNLVISNNLKGLSYLLPLAFRIFGLRERHIIHDIQLLHPSGLVFYAEEKKLDSFLVRCYRAVNRRLFSFPEKVFSPSAWLLKEHERRGFFKKNQTEILPNPAIGGTPESPDRIFRAPFTFLYAGQLEKHKGVDLLLKAFEKISLSRPGEARLVILGEGKASVSLRVSAPAGADFLGKKDAAGVAAEMLKADCLVVPSLCYENSPLVIYEAMASGLPVIGSDLGGIPELLSLGAGLVFRPGDIGDLAEKMAAVMADKNLFVSLAKQGREKVKNFSLGNYVQRLLS